MLFGSITEKPLDLLKFGCFLEFLEQFTTGCTHNFTQKGVNCYGDLTHLPVMNTAFPCGINILPSKYSIKAIPAVPNVTSMMVFEVESRQTHFATIAPKPTTDAILTNPLSIVIGMSTRSNRYSISNQPCGYSTNIIVGLYLVPKHVHI